MLDVSNDHNNHIAFQGVTLPRSYLNYLSSKSIRANSVADNNVVITHELNVFPGIEFEEQDQENIKVWINEQTLPSYARSTQTQTQTNILNALKVLASISTLSVDVIEPESRKELAQPLHEALEKYLCVEKNSQSSKLPPNPAAALIVLIARTVAISAIIMASAVLLSPLVFPFIIPSLLTVAASTTLIASLFGYSVMSYMQNMQGILNFAAVSKVAKTACDKLEDVVKETNGKIEDLSLKTPGIEEEPQASSSATANESSGSKSAGDEQVPPSPDQPSTSGIYSASNVHTMYQQAATNGSDAEQDDTLTAAYQSN